MDFEYSPGQEALRQEVQRRLEANITPDLRVDDATDERVAGDRETFYALPATCPVLTFSFFEV